MANSLSRARSSSGCGVRSSAAPVARAAVDTALASQGASLALHASTGSDGECSMDARAALLLCGSASQVLARIARGDPLGLRVRVAHALRERQLLVDLERAHRRVLVHCARQALSWRGEPRLSRWLTRQVDAVLDELEDTMGEQHPAGAEAELGRRFQLGGHALAEAAAAVQAHPVHERRAFFDLVLEHRGLDESSRRGECSATECASRARAVLMSVLAALEDSGCPSAPVRKACT